MAWNQSIPTIPMCTNVEDLDLLREKGWIGYYVRRRRLHRGRCCKTQFQNSFLLPIWHFLMHQETDVWGSSDRAIVVHGSKAIDLQLLIYLNQHRGKRLARLTPVRREVNADDLVFEFLRCYNSNTKNKVDCLNMTWTYRCGTSLW